MILRKRVFLLVDDAISNVKMLKMLLTRKGIDCYLAHNGQEAVDAYQSSLLSLRDHGARKLVCYDCIFMDFTMPVMNGPSATKAIRALGYSGLICGLTGNALLEEQEIFLRSGNI